MKSRNIQQATNIASIQTKLNVSYNYCIPLIAIDVICNFQVLNFYLHSI